MLFKSFLGVHTKDGYVIRWMVPMSLLVDIIHGGTGLTGGGEEMENAIAEVENENEELVILDPNHVS